MTLGGKYSQVQVLYQRTLNRRAGLTSLDSTASLYIFSLVTPNLVTSMRPLFNDYILNGFTYFIAHWPSEQSQLLTHNLLSPFYDELLVEKIMTYIGDTCKLLLMQKARSCISTVE